MEATELNKILIIAIVSIALLSFITILHFYKKNRELKEIVNEVYEENKELEEELKDTEYIKIDLSTMIAFLKNHNLFTNYEKTTEDRKEFIENVINAFYSKCQRCSDEEMEKTNEELIKEIQKVL